MPAQNPVAQTITDPRHTFLTTSEVFARYRWGRTKGYEMLKTDGFPRSIGGAYRLDTLIGWEDKQLAGETTDDTTSADDAPTLPEKRRPGRPSRQAQAA